VQCIWISIKCIAKEKKLETTVLDDNVATMKPTQKANIVVSKKYLYDMQVP